MAEAPDSFPPAVVVATADEVGQACARIAAALQPVVDGEDCVLLGILLGGLVPMARVAGMLHGDFIMDYCQVSRYRGGERGGELRWLQPPGADLAARSVLLIDDIFDEGVTLEYVRRECLALGARRVISSVLVRKRHARTATSVRPDHVGLEVDDRYVFGCGMDFRDRWRHLPDIYALTGAP